MVRRLAKGITGSPFRLGMALIVLALVAGVGLFSKDRIITTVSPGTTIEASFDRDYRLRPYLTEAKIAGIPVGKVTAVEPAEDGSTTVSIKIDDDAVAKLQSAPSAVIRATTLLGGKYYVDLIPGGQPGDFGGAIPQARTQTPVELDSVVRSLQPNALDSAKSSIRSLDQTLDRRGRAAIDRLLAEAPGTLDPAADALTAAQGTRPAKDLPALVSGLEAVGRTLSERPGQLDSIVANLETVSTVLGQRSGDLEATLAGMPAALDSADAGLRRLDATLGKLRETAGPARPVVRELKTTLRHADPVLMRARPVVNDLRTLMVDARPAIQGLVPASQGLSGVLDDVRGPGLDRLNGPVKSAVFSPFKGTGPYKLTRSDRPFYRELGYMFANLDRSASKNNANGATQSWYVTVGPGTLQGLPLVNLEQLLHGLTRLDELKREGR